MLILLLEVPDQFSVLDTLQLQQYHYQYHITTTYIVPNTKVL